MALPCQQSCKQDKTSEFFKNLEVSFIIVNFSSGLETHFQDISAGRTGAASPGLDGHTQADKIR